MSLVSLVDELNSRRIRLLDVNPSQVWVDNLKDVNEVRGRLAEGMVGQWLDGCNGVSFEHGVPKRVNGYAVEQKGAGRIKIYTTADGKRKDIHEYDFLLTHEGKPVMAEVMSLKLNGFAGSGVVERGFRLGEELFGTDDLGMLVFFPHYTNKQAAAAKIEAMHPNVRCVDLGYKKKQMQRAVAQWYNAKGFKQPGYTPPTKRRKH